MDSLRVRRHVLGAAIHLALGASVLSVPVSAKTIVIRNEVLETVPTYTGDSLEVYSSRIVSTSDTLFNDTVIAVDGGALHIERSTLGSYAEGISALKFRGGANSGLIVGSEIFTHGAAAVGVDVAGTRFLPSGDVAPTGALRLVDTRIRTAGVDAHGAAIGPKMQLGLDASSIMTGGAGAAGVWMFGGTLLLERGSTIVTTGDNATGIHAQAQKWRVPPGGFFPHVARVALSGSDVRVTGEGSVGIRAGYTGLYPDGIGSTITLTDSRILAERGHGVQFLGGDSNLLDVTAGSQVQGRESAVHAATAGSINRVVVDDGTLVGEQSAVWVQNGATMAVEAHDAVIEGRAFADDRSRLDMRLSGTDWNARGASQVDDLTLHRGSRLWLGRGAVGDQLVVRGDLDIDASTLFFDAVLGDDGTRADHLRVEGDTRGSGGIVVNNLGGRGAATVEGIELIHVGGRSDATFQLQGRAVAGAYDYFLFKGSVSDPGDGHWYLRSELAPVVVDPCEATPDLPGCVELELPGVPERPELPERPRPVPEGGTGEVLVPPPLPPPPPVLRPEPGAYLGNQRAAIDMFALRRDDRATARAEGGAWIRVSGRRAAFGTAGLRIDTAGHSLLQLQAHGNSSVLQLGTQVLAWDGVGHASLGVMLGQGRADTTVVSTRTGYSARGEVTGTSIGVYGGWQQQADAAAGAYLAGAVQAGRYRNTVQGAGLEKERHDAATRTAALEVGYAWRLRFGSTALYVQPQAEVVWTGYRSDALVEHNGTVIEKVDQGQVEHRVGLRVFGHAIGTAQIVQPFIEANWRRGGTRTARVFDGQVLRSDLPRDRHELRAGAQVGFSGGWSGSAALGVEQGQGAYRTVQGQLTLRRGW